MEIKERILDACSEDDCPVWLVGEVGQLINSFENKIRSESKKESGRDIGRMIEEMKEFIDRLIERLEEERTTMEDKRLGYEYESPWRDCYYKTKGVVNELVEEYAKTPTPIHSIPIDTQKYIEELESRAKATVELTDREREVLNTNLSAEIMKMQYHYGNNVPERLQVLYNLRDKLCHKEE